MSLLRSTDMRTKIIIIILNNAFNNQLVIYLAQLLCDVINQDKHDVDVAHPQLGHLSYIN